MPPSADILKAFGLSGDVVPTHSRDVWRVGTAAVKRVGDTEAAEWLCDLLTSRQRVQGVRLPRPIASHDGAWTVDGWSSAEWLTGEPDGSRWSQILEAGAAFHAWLAGVARPAWIGRVDDPWHRSDRAAWGEQPIDTRPDFEPLIDELTAMRRPVTATDQLVHGDLTGNVLFSPGAQPAIIDLSLYWRPPEYAAAIVAVDAYEWEGVGVEALEHVAALPDGQQVLVRAALFRILRAAMVGWANPEARLDIHHRTVVAIRRIVE